MSADALRLHFEIHPTATESALLLECQELATRLEDTPDDEIDRLYDERSEAFKAAFPPVEDEEHPFSSFLALFQDPDVPTLGATISASEDGTVRITGTDTDVDALAFLLHRCVPSIQPFGFEWSDTVDRHGSGSYGGGFFAITPRGIIGGSTRYLLEQTLKSLGSPSTI